MTSEAIVHLVMVSLFGSSPKELTMIVSCLTQEPRLRFYLNDHHA